MCAAARLAPVEHTSPVAQALKRPAQSLARESNSYGDSARWSAITCPSSVSPSPRTGLCNDIGSTAARLIDPTSPGDTCRLRDLLHARLTTAIPNKRTLRLADRVQLLHHMNGNSDRAGLISYRLADAPRRICREPKPLAVIEPLNRPNQPQHSLLNQIQERRLVAIPLSDRDHQPPVGLDQPLLGVQDRRARPNLRARPAPMRTPPAHRGDRLQEQLPGASGPRASDPPHRPVRDASGVPAERVHGECWIGSSSSTRSARPGRVQPFDAGVVTSRSVTIAASSVRVSPPKHSAADDQVRAPFRSRCPRSAAGPRPA